MLLAFHVPIEHIFVWMWASLGLFALAAGCLVLSLACRWAARSNGRVRLPSVSVFLRSCAAVFTVLLLVVLFGGLAWFTVGLVLSWGRQ
jgi:hypothetical protein